MFEAVELGQKVDKQAFKEAVAELRTRLVRAQFASSSHPGPILILVAGLDGAGKGELLNFLGGVIDLRDVKVCTFWNETDEERERPYWWRFWRALPNRGQIAILFGAWYTRWIHERTADRIDSSEFERQLRRVAQFEQMLANDGATVLKFWLHITHKTQKRRLKKLKGRVKHKDALSRALWHSRHYDEIVAAAEQMIRRTDRAHARWQLVEATQPRHAKLTVLRAIAETLEGLKPPRPAAPATPSAPVAPVLQSVELEQRLEPEAYKQRLATSQAEIERVVWRAYDQRVSSVVIFEGWDAAGKGGSIRRLVDAMDMRLVQVRSIAAPTDEERNHHYLWRFWRHLPRAGYVTLYDRSWYGRVLVERVEGFATPDDWRRAYEEINEFEEQLTEAGVVVVKLWLHLSPEEQLRRFKAREQVPWKQHKLTEEDWRNREQWSAYEEAVNEMVLRTSTSHAPWHLVPADDKRLARVRVVETYASAMRARLSSTT